MEKGAFYMYVKWELLSLHHLGKYQGNKQEILSQETVIKYLSLTTKCMLVSKLYLNLAFERDQMRDFRKRIKFLVCSFRPEKDSSVSKLIIGLALNSLAGGYWKCSQIRLTLFQKLWPPVSDSPLNGFHIPTKKGSYPFPPLNNMQGGDIILFGLLRRNQINSKLDLQIVHAALLWILLQLEKYLLQPSAYIKSP